MATGRRRAESGRAARPAGALDRRGAHRQLDGDVKATDVRGQVPLVTGLAEDDEGEEVRRWGVTRSTYGPIEVSYLAEPVAEEPRLQLHRSNFAAKATASREPSRCFLVLPPGPEDLTFELRWSRPVAGERSSERWMAVCSLGEGDGRDGELAGTGLELLGDTYVMCGDLADHHHRDGLLSTWWLTSPGVDVEAFSATAGNDVSGDVRGASTHRPVGTESSCAPTRTEVPMPPHTRRRS